MHNLKYLEKAIANPRAHWDDLEDTKAGCVGWRLGLKGRAHWTSVWKNMGVGVLCGEPSTIVHNEESAFAYQHLA